MRFGDPEDRQAAVEVFQSAPDVTIETDRRGLQPQAVDPVSAVLIAAGVLATAKFVADWWERRRGGLIIVLNRDSGPDISRHNSLPYGYVLITSPDGATELTVRDAPKDATERLLAQVIESASGGIEAVAAAIGGVLGSDGVERSQREPDDDPMARSGGGTGDGGT